MTELIQFAIPTKYLQRTIQFYQELLREEVIIEIDKSGKKALITDNATRMAIGYLYYDKPFIPDMFGVTIYFQIRGTLKNKLEKVKRLGGKILLSKNYNFISEDNALIQDSEGNRIGLIQKI